MKPDTDKLSGIGVPAPESWGRYRIYLAFLQAGYYGITGVWPLLHRPSFEGVTGPKQDWWLVITVGLLAMAIGFCLFCSAIARKVSSETIRLAIASAAAFTIVDVVFVLNGTIWPTYLADAVLQVVLMGAWFLLIRDPSPGEQGTAQTVSGGVPSRS